MVQKAMAVARPRRGEKSRTSAGVATRIIPSRKPPNQLISKKDQALVVRVRLRMIRELSKTPYTTRLARPMRSERLPRSEETAPRAPRSTFKKMYCENEIPKNLSARGATEGSTYAS